MATPAPPPANGLTSGQYLRYLQGLSLWNNIQENQQRNYPSVGEMYAVSLPHMLQQLAGNVGNIFTAQSADDTRALQQQNLQSEIADRSAQGDLRRAQLEALQSGNYAQQMQQARADLAQKKEDDFWSALGKAQAPQTTTTTTPGPAMPSVAEPGNELGQAPPIPTSTTSSTTKQPTFGEAFQSLLGQGMVPPKNAQDAYLRYATAPEKAQAGYNLSPGQVRFGPDNQQVAAVPAPERPAPAPKEPNQLALDRVRAERNLNDKGIANPDEAAVADEMARIQSAAKIDVAGAEAKARQDITEGKELTGNARTSVVDQYGRPITGSITAARIRDEGLIVLPPATLKAVAQVAQIETPFKDMLNVIEKGKLPQATGISVYDYVNAYKSLVTGNAKQFSDPDIANFKSAQQNILFPLIQFEGGSPRAALQELKLRIAANPQLLDTDIAAAAQAEQLADIVETRLHAAGLTPSPGMQTQIDRAHELAAKINARVSAGQQGQGSGGGFWNTLLGGGGAPAAAPQTGGGRTITLPSGKVVTVGE